MNIDCWVIGMIIYLCIYCLILLSPPTSSNVVVGISVKPYFFKKGWTFLIDYLSDLKSRIGSDSFNSKHRKPAYFTNTIKSEGIKPDVYLAIYTIYYFLRQFLVDETIFVKTYCLILSPPIFKEITFSYLFSFLSETSIF